MTQLPAVIPETLCPTVQRRRNELAVLAERMGEGYRLNGYDNLLPIEDLRQIVTEMEGALVPADNGHIGKWAALLVDGYRLTDKAFRNEDHAKVFIRSLSFDLSDFPPDIIERTVHEVRRSCKFLPSCAEVYQHAEGLMAERKGLLRAAQAQIREHERRAKEEERRRSFVPYSELPPEKQKEFDDTFARLHQDLRGAAEQMERKQKAPSEGAEGAQEADSGASGASDGEEER